MCRGGLESGAAGNSGSADGATLKLLRQRPSCSGPGLDLRNHALLQKPCAGSGVQHDQGRWTATFRCVLAPSRVHACCAGCFRTLRLSRGAVAAYPLTPVGGLRAGVLPNALSLYQKGISSSGGPPSGGGNGGSASRSGLGPPPSIFMVSATISYEYRLTPSCSQVSERMRPSM